MSRTLHPCIGISLHPDQFEAPFRENVLEDPEMLSDWIMRGKSRIVWPTLCSRHASAVPISFAMVFSLNSGVKSSLMRELVLDVTEDKVSVVTFTANFASPGHELTVWRAMVPIGGEMQESPVDFAAE